jgi:chromosomal replication initiation ATPase DnaA
LGGQLRLELEHAADFARGRFIVSEPNRETVNTLDVWPDDRGGVLALIGPAGVGKSHLAAAWAERVGAKTVMVDGPADRIGELSGRLLLEDADRAPHGEAFFHLLNKAQTPSGCLLITGRTAPGSWPVQVPDLRSRLNAIPVIALTEPDDAVLRGILLKLFQERNIRPPPDLIAYLLPRIERSAGAARALVVALDEAASAQNRAVSRPLAREILHDETDDGDEIA